MSNPTKSFPPQSNTPAATDLRQEKKGDGNFPAPNSRGCKDDIAPLGAPALVLGVLLIGAGIAALLRVRSWSRDYGSLVYVAHFLYLSLAGSLSVWGFRLRRSSNMPNPPAIRHRAVHQSCTASAGGRSPSKCAADTTVTVVW
ncbi:hypothetical protein [Nocardia sp. bgisy134]|uniref:hypothetical protein n=1 Tax=Nocardia sp. bgisy134 TaxID=3413789 RepID=UPI003D72BFC6